MLLSVLLITAYPCSVYCADSSEIDISSDKVYGESTDTSNDDKTAADNNETANDESAADDVNPYEWDNSWDEYLTLDTTCVTINSPTANATSISLGGMEKSGLDVSDNNGCYDGLSDNAYFSYPIDNLVYCYFSDNGTIDIYPASDSAEGSIDVTLHVRGRSFTFTVNLYNIT